jgi:hypothetical protein
MAMCFPSKNQNETVSALRPMATKLPEEELSKGVGQWNHYYVRH